MKLWNKNYTMVVIGQVISLFANNILHFALTLYILDLMGTGYAFVITAVSTIPMVLLMPFGGILADRVNKKKILVAMDCLTGCTVLIAFPAISGSSPVFLITVVLAILSVIEAFYNPCTQASIPVLQEPENLVKANAIVNQIGMAANVIGAVLGGVLYGVIGIYPILIGCVVCFAGSAILEIFITVPHIAHETAVTGLFNIVRHDLKEAMDFVLKEQRNILKLIASIAVINFTFSAMLTVALPYLIRIVLGLSSQLYGFATGLVSAAGLLGGVIAALLANKLNFKALFKMLIFMGLTIMPVGIGFLITDNKVILYILILVFLMAGEICAQTFSIFSVTAIELITPVKLLGKVMALIVAIAICAEPLGRGVYGIAFEQLKNHVWIVLVISSLFTILFSLPIKEPLAEIERINTLLRLSSAKEKEVNE